MNCICGCGTRLGQKAVELNLLAGEVAIELVVWDKARALRSPVAAGEVEGMLREGAPRYQQLLAGLHAGGELGEGEREEIDAWLEGSRVARRQLADRLPAVPKKKVVLSAGEQARIDRVHPERTFTGEPATVPSPAPTGDSELEALLSAALADVREGRAEEAERALRRFLAERG